MEASRLTRTLRAAVGERLRAVATYAGTDRHLHYLRDDVRGKADVERVDRIHEELVFDAIGGRYLEGLFELGDLRATAQHFEEGTIVHVAGEGYLGVFVSVDAEAAGQTTAVVDACRTWLRDRPSTGGSPMRRSE